MIGQVPAEHGPDLWDMFVTEAGTIYVADGGQKKVFALRPGDATFTEVLQCPDPWRPVSLVVQDRSLYVSMVDPADLTSGSISEYELPPQLQLE